MKTLIKVLVVSAVLVVIAWALLDIGSEENSIRLNNDWGIAKDHPRK